jgi:TPR repeat protein
MHCYRVAARAGDKKAQYNLGLSYLAGDGVVASRRWARHWLARAASQGYRKAKTQLRRLSGAKV